MLNFAKDDCEIISYNCRHFMYHLHYSHLYYKTNPNTMPELYKVPGTVSKKDWMTIQTKNQ